MDAFRYWVAMVSMILSVIGAINWGLVGLLHVNVVSSIFGGPDTPATRFVYIIVGIAGILLLLFSPLWSITPTSTRQRPAGI
jgi:uncharacterized membrane protein YuzA (DUF378 family)